MDISKIEEMISIYPEDGRLPCPVAHYIAAYMKIAPREVGDAATRLGISLYQCQLGLFGYGRKGVSSYKIVGRDVEIPDEVLDIIRKSATEGKVSCADLWAIAEEADLNRAEVGNAADAAGLKITPCQLGAF